MMSVSDLFYGGREAVWIINTPNSGKKSSSNNPQTPQRFNQTPPPQTPQRFNQTPPPQTPQRFYQTPPQYNQQAMQYSPMQVIPYNVHTPQSASRGGVNADGQHYNSVVELNVPVCCEACEERVKYALLNISGVESVNCDSFSQSVVVTGNAAPAEVLRICRKLHKRSTLLQKKGPQNMMASPMWTM